MSELPNQLALSSPFFIRWTNKVQQGYSYVNLMAGVHILQVY